MGLCFIFVLLDFCNGYHSCSNRSLLYIELETLLEDLKLFLGI